MEPGPAALLRPSREIAAPAQSDRETVAERGAIRRAMRIGTWVWPAFFAADVYMCLVLYPGAPLWLFAFYRAAVETVIAAVYRASHKPGIAVARLAWWQNAAFFVAALCIAMMALHLGGPRSAYMHGVSIVILVRAAVIPEPWQRSWRTFLGLAIVFPLVMVVAAAMSSSARADWLTAASLATFGANYLFVLASAVVGTASGHTVWAARQQVYKARRLGRYRLTAQLGRGGMGEVWLAWDASLRRNVALKILHADSGPDPDSVRRFEREAQSASQLRGPHTTQVYDFGASDDGVYYIAMEYLPGVDLRRLVEQQGPLAPARAVHFLEQACVSVAEAHEAGLVHCDIKPPNLFATRIGGEYDFLKLLDFGIARFAAGGAQADVTQSALVRGTPGYLAPELWQGAKADARSDLYSLGATLYYLLTGVPPFAPTADRGLVRTHLQETPIAPSVRLGQALPRELDALVLRCLAKAPEDRFWSVHDLHDALGRVPLARRWSPEDARRCWRDAGEVGIEPFQPATVP